MHSLNDELNAMQRLLDLIRQEQEQLTEANIEGLQAITQEKAQAISRISTLADARHKLLAQAGLPAGDASMQPWLERSADTAASATWQQLLSVAGAAKEQNRINGLLINKQMARNQNALSVLQGNTQANHFYGPNGQTTAKPSTTRLVIG